MPLMWLYVLNLAGLWFTVNWEADELDKGK